MKNVVLAIGACAGLLTLAACDGQQEEPVAVETEAVAPAPVEEAQVAPEMAPAEGDVATDAVDAEAAATETAAPTEDATAPAE